MARLRVSNYHYSEVYYPAIYVFNAPYTENACPLFGGVLTWEDAAEGFWTEGDDLIVYNSAMEEITADSNLLTADESYVIRVYATDSPMIPQ